MKKSVFFASTLFFLVGIFFAVATSYAEEFTIIGKILGYSCAGLFLFAGVKAMKEAFKKPIKQK